jgi:hypothetical protein
MGMTPLGAAMVMPIKTKGAGSGLPLRLGADQTL